MPTNCYFLLFAMGIFVSCQTNIPVSETTSIIPLPQQQELHEGYFELSSRTQLVYDEALKEAAGFLKQWIETGSSIRLSESNSDVKIVFRTDPSINHPEGYKLHIGNKEIILSASSETGAFYAAQSLRQLLPASFENGKFHADAIKIRSMSIEDYPAFTYRGMHLDVGRHFFSVEFIKKYIDYMAMLKMNTFHWHLTEDQGWRIEIKKYPKLQEIAAYRDETLIGHYNEVPQRFDGTRYGGYYTQEEAHEIVEYAAKRHLTVIPEIEMPGHSQAAIAAYPELGCTGENPGVATKWGIFNPIYCSKDETFSFLEGVLDEVLTVFPSTYIHIGGDEAPKTHWKACEKCQAVIHREGLKDEHELQSYFITRIEKYLHEKGRQIIGWDEILEGGLAPHATVMSWRGTDGAIAAAKQGNHVVMTPNSHCYFDYYQSENENEPLAIGGYLPLEKVYHFNPIPDELTQEEAAFVLGAQANLWTEYIRDEKQVEYMLFPRITALSEVVWNQTAEKNYLGFVERLVVFLKRLDALNVNYANHLYEVKGQLLSDGNTSSYALETLLKHVDIRYTTDGTEPSHNAPQYSQPIPFTEDINLKAAVFDQDKMLGSVFSQSLEYHQAVGKNITINVEPHHSYRSGGKKALINGIQGKNKRYGDSEWLGFWGDDLEITIDLGSEIDVRQIKTRFYHAPGQWIYAPKEIEINLLDNDGGSLSVIPAKLKVRDSFPHQQYAEENINLRARFLILKVKNYGTIPENAQGAGHKAWTFMDEIIVK